MASLKICLCRQVFVCVETSRLHLAWSAVDRNLTFFWLSKQTCPNFVSSATRAFLNNKINFRNLMFGTIEMDCKLARIFFVHIDAL